MPSYISFHTLACLTRQGAEEISRKLQAAPGITTRRLLWNLAEGKLLAEFEAPDRASLEAWLAQSGFHYQWLLRVEFESARGQITAA